MKTKQISLQEYAEKISPIYFRQNLKCHGQPITQQAIKYRVKKGMELPEVHKYSKVGKIHVLVVDANF